MISLVCSKCGTTLSVDDGFAGGVCRCIKCGTIQTVPGKSARPGAMSGRSIYERADRAGNTSKDLETLGEIVTSSGLVGSGMLSQSRRVMKQPAAPSKRLPIAIGAGVAVLLGIAGIVWLSSRSTSNDAGNPTIAPTNQSKPTVGKVEPVALTSGPRFGPIALDSGGTVVYLLDRGAATQAYTGPLRQVVVSSIQTLGPTRKFQVRYWSAFGESPVFPPSPGEATPANLGKLSTWFDEIVGGQATETVESLAEALATKPAEIVVVTGKAWQLDDGFVNEVSAKLPAGGGIKIHGVSLGVPSTSDALQRVVTKTGGTYVELDQGALERLAR